MHYAEGNYEIMQATENGKEGVVMSGALRLWYLLTSGTPDGMIFTGKHGNGTCISECFNYHYH